MDINKMDQGLLKPNPSLTQEQFNHHWLYNHASLVVPFFLSLISNYNGEVGFPSQEEIDKPMNLPKWKGNYYRKVILVDERRFLAIEVLAHIKRLKPQSVKGERKVVIYEG